MAVAAWSRLSGHPPDRPQRIDWSAVSRVETAIVLTVGHATVSVDGFETWVRDRIIAAIPGSGVKPE